jgi:hypothetical protein
MRQSRNHNRVGGLGAIVLSGMLIGCGATNAHPNVDEAAMSTTLCAIQHVTPLQMISQQREALPDDIEPTAQQMMADYLLLGQGLEEIQKKHPDQMPTPREMHTDERIQNLSKTMIDQYYDDPLTAFTDHAAISARAACMDEFRRIAESLKLENTDELSAANRKKLGRE